MIVMIMVIQVKLASMQDIPFGESTLQELEEIAQSTQDEAQKSTNENRTCPVPKKQMEQIS